MLKLSDEELKERGVSCYLLRIKHGVYLDCEEQAKAGHCFASMSNCYRKLVHRNDESIKAVPNCALVNYSPGTNHLWLSLTKLVRPMDEVLWDYGDDFHV